MRTAIILAGGYSKRFGQDKCLITMAGKPLLTHVYQRAREVVEEVIIVVKSSSQKKVYSRFFPNKTRVVVDIEDSRSPLVGASTGFENAKGEYSILLPCDTPFVSKQVLELLFDLSQNVDGVIPRWPNGYIEPLQASYRTSSALSAAKKSLEKGETTMRSMIPFLGRVRYLSTIVIEELNPQLTTFFNVNTPMDLKKAERLFEKKRDR